MPRWNWQQPDWPHFTWDAGRLARAEERLLHTAGLLTGTARHLSAGEKEQLNVEAMSTGAVTTSEIEGEILDRASVQSSIRRQLGLATEPRRVRPSEQGIAEMMVNLYRSWAAPLTDETMFAWHRMLLRGRTDLTDIGGYRTGTDPMEVVSGALYDPRVHFEAPPSAGVPREMKAFVEWFNASAAMAALTRAGIAHLYFVSIHPFEDGNGRIGRAISEKALAQNLGEPPLTALAATILIRRKAYYDALEAANKANEITPWLAWFGGTVLEAQRRTIAQVDFLIDQTRLLDGLRGRLNERQEKALRRMLREGPEGFRGGLSAGNYTTITGASPATTTRDLADLVAKGALARRGERRHARYDLAIQLHPVGLVTVDQTGEVHEQPG